VVARDRRLLEHPSPGTLFELLADGRVVEWEIRNL
jgi:hypothetical protein